MKAILLRVLSYLLSSAVLLAFIEMQRHGSFSIAVEQMTSEGGIASTLQSFVILFAGHVVTLHVVPIIAERLWRRPPD
jgi:hypothetical protein